jgi:hypothetical protein
MEDVVFQQINQLALKFYQALGCTQSEDYDFSEAKHPTERLMFFMAEIAYEHFYGDSPDYGNSDE